MDKETIEKELAALGKFSVGQIIGDKWKIVQKLDEGGFGSVFKVQHLQDLSKFAALKVERANADEINYLKLEAAVLKELHDKGMRAHVPQLYRSAKRKHYCYIIITLLGDNLKKLKDKHFPKGMPLRTWTRIGVQCLYGIKTMHDRGYVHRDIKAQNFVLGYHSTPACARIVYIIDFGLARAYAYPPSPKGSNKWIARKARARLEFRGTWRYAAPSMHEEMEQGRKDDLWSWLFMMMDLYCGLPWVETDTKETIELKKLHMKDEALMIRMPDELKFIAKHLRGLDVYQRPDYLRIFAAFESIRKRRKVSYDDPYEWETKEAAAANKRAMLDKSAPIGYANAELFFKSDPIGVFRAPTRKEQKETNDRFIFKDLPPPPVAAAPSPAVSSTCVAAAAAAAASAEPVGGSGENLSAKRVSSNEDMQPFKPPKSTSPAVKTTPTSTPTMSPVTSKEGKKATPKVALSARIEKTLKKKKKSRKSKKNNSKKENRHESEDSSDFVPSCYMQLEIPKLYLPQNVSDKEFQKKAVSMDWGHVEPIRNMREVVTPVIRSPPRETGKAEKEKQQESSSGKQSSDSSQGCGSNQSSNRSEKESAEIVEKAPNSLAQSPIQDENDRSEVAKEKQESSNSNRSVSLAHPGGNMYYYQQDRCKKKK